MKRFALLLAAVGLGSGCVASPCDPRDLNVDWSFVDSSGIAGRVCNSGALSATIDSVDIYIDGVYENTYPCSGGVTYPDFPSGTHEILVEGFSGATIITRDVRSVSVESCGPTNVLMYPGETYLDFFPSSCTGGVGTTYLAYTLYDENWSPPVALRTVTTGGTSPCLSGVLYPPRVPYGYYSLANVEELKWVVDHYELTNWGTCSNTVRSVFYGDTGQFTVAMYDTALAACP